MKLLLAGEDRPGALLRSLEPGLRQRWDVTVVDPANAVTRLIDRSSLVTRVRRRARTRRTAPCFHEALEQLQPDVTLVIKGSGLTSQDIATAGVHGPIAIYYPDNPFWRIADNADAAARLAAADLAIVWSDRLRLALEPTCQRVATVPFGYDPAWFPRSDPGTQRSGIAFAGTWSLRRERFLRALEGLDLTIVGWGWDNAAGLATGPPRYGSAAGELLAGAAIGINLLHPHNAGAHNMRTREIMASGALQLTDPGTDGTPFRDGIGCRWFSSPGQLRELVDHYLAHPGEASALATSAQTLAAHETYEQRTAEISQLLGRLL
ncbi:unannotated protein [freshwater metagenome]|uniref:Unannotated protein n=1 Tax=freshwater metagenome TaxID=449393 RepID=A0A6J7F504_9ZZZZ|nr:glycosyltransferase [Actinomycetota bacterium]